MLHKLLILIILIVSIVTGVYFGFKLLLILIPFILAWLISNLLTPFVARIHRKTKIHFALLTFFTLLLFIGVNLLIFSVIGVLVINQAEGLLERFPEIAEIAKETFVSITKEYVNIQDSFPGYVGESLNLDFSSILKNVNISVTTILASVVGVVAIVPNLLVAVIVMFVAAFFMTKDKDKIKDIEMKILSHKIFRGKLIKVIKEDVLMVLFGYLKAQLILMTLTFVEISIGLSILRVPNAILIGLGIGVLDAMPVFGTGTVFLPWVVITIFYGNYSLAAGLFIVYLIATLGRQAIEPKIISTQIGIHPLITLLTIYTGIKIFGVLGIIIAPFIAITLLAVKKSGILKFE